MRTIRSLRVDFFGQVIISVLQIFSVPIILRECGNEGYGKWLTILALISWSVLGDFGFSTNLTRAIINREENVGEKKKELAALNLVISTFFGITYFVLFEYFFEKTYAGFWPLSIAIFLNINLTTITAQIEASDYQSKLRAGSHVSKFIELVGYVCIALIYPTVELFSWAYLLSVVFKFGICVYVFISFFKIREIRPSFGFIKNVVDFKESFYLQLNKLINNYTVYADLLIIGYFSAIQVAEYSNNLIFWQYACLLIGSKVSINFFPIMDRFEKNLTLKVSFILAICFVGFVGSLFYYFLGVQILNTWITGVAIKSDIWIVVMSLFLLTEFLTRAFGNLIYINKSLTKTYILVSTTEMILNFILTLLLYHYFELVGVLIATLLCRVFFTLRFIVKNCVKDKMLRNLIFRLYLILSLIMVFDQMISIKYLVLFLALLTIVYLFRYYKVGQNMKYLYVSN